MDFKATVTSIIPYLIPLTVNVHYCVNVVIPSHHSRDATANC